MKPTNSLFLLIVFGLITALILVFSSPYFGLWEQPTTTPIPSVFLSVSINGISIDTNSTEIINVVRGSTLIPELTVDWVMNTNGKVELSFCGQEIETGKPIVLSTLGLFTLKAMVLSDKWRIAETISFEVTNNPRHQLSANVEHFSILSGGAFEIEIRLFQDKAKIEGIYPSHVSLWLLDNSNRTTDRLPISTQQNESQRGFYVENQHNSWLMHFLQDQDTSQIEISPTHFMLTGSGWRGDAQVDFTTVPRELPIELTRNIASQKNQKANSE